MPVSLQARYRRLSHLLCYAPSLTPQGADLMVRLDAAANELKPVLSARQRDELRQLRANYNLAVHDINTSFNPSDRMYETEQRTYDALVDFVDANNLTYTTYDPRGTR